MRREKCMESIWGREMKRKIIKAMMAVIALTVPVNAEYVSSREGLNVRERPDINSAVITVLPYAAEVSPTRKAGDWVKIDGGYVKCDYLQKDNPLDGMEYLGNWHITAYAYTGSPCANGNYPEPGYTIACNSLPFGTEVYIEGVGFRTVEDRGPGWLGSEWCDLYLGDTASCIVWGSQYRGVWLVD